MGILLRNKTDRTKIWVLHGVIKTQQHFPGEAQKLLGRWNGKAGPFSLVLRFERNACGKYVVVIDDTKIDSKTYKGYMFIKASMNGANLSMKTPFFGPEFSGKLNFLGNKIGGTWKAKELDSPPRYSTTPLSLTKERFVRITSVCNSSPHLP